MLTGCATSMARVPVAQKNFPLTIAVHSENKLLSKTFIRVINESGIVESAHNPGNGKVADIVLSIDKLDLLRRWKRNTWAYVTAIPGFPFAFLTSSIFIIPIYGPYGGYAWFPSYLVPMVTVNIEANVSLSLGPLATKEITESASSMCKLQRSWVQLGRIDDKWFSTVLGSDWDKNYETEKYEWQAFFDPEKYDWSEIETVVYHNMACKTVSWLEDIMNKLEEGW